MAGEPGTDLLAISWRIPAAVPNRISSGNQDVVIEIELPHQDIIPPARGYKYVKTRNTIDSIPRPRRGDQATLRRRHRPGCPTHTAWSLRSHHQWDRRRRRVQWPSNNDRQSDRPRGTPAPPQRDDWARALYRTRTRQSRPSGLPQTPQCTRLTQPLWLGSSRAVHRIRFVPIPLYGQPRCRGHSGQPTQPPQTVAHRVRAPDPRVVRRDGGRGMEHDTVQGRRSWCRRHKQESLFGGVCLIQAKRYTGVVGLEAVHALTGVMTDHNATTGVLVTTSWFGRASEEFARRNRITLINGAELKHLIMENLHLDVLPGTSPPRQRQHSPRANWGDDRETQSVRRCQAARRPARKLDRCSPLTTTAAVSRAT